MEKHSAVNSCYSMDGNKFFGNKACGKRSEETAPDNYGAFFEGFFIYFFFHNLDHFNNRHPERSERSAFKHSISNFY